MNTSMTQLISLSKKAKKSYETVYWYSLVIYDLNPSEFLVLFLIKGLSKMTGECYSGKKHLAEMLNLTQPTVFKSINVLIKKGLIEKTGKKSNGVIGLRPTYIFTDFIKSLQGIDAYNDMS